MRRSLRMALAGVLVFLAGAVLWTVVIVHGENVHRTLLTPTVTCSAGSALVGGVCVSDTFDADAGCCTIPEGLWIVGKDITPGLYRVTVTNDFGCYWERRSTVDQTVEGVIANGFKEKGVVNVTIKKTDKAFFSSGCGRWDHVDGR